MHKSYLFFAVSAVMWLGGCTALFKPAGYNPRTAFVKSDWPADLAQNENMREALQQGLAQSLCYYGSRPDAETTAMGPETYTAAQMRSLLQNVRDKFAAEKESARLNEWLKDNFQIYRPVSGNVQITAYCRPRLRASRKPSTQYPYPVYRVPNDWVYVQPADFIKTSSRLTDSRMLVGRVTPERRVIPGYFTREEIDFGNTLTGKGYELSWVDSLADLYFLQVEGSGILEYEDGSTTTVAYAGSNGQPYRGISRLLIQEGRMKPETCSIPGMKKYLAEHPVDLRRILSSNPSYVFFEPGQAYALGCLKVPLTPYVSAAVDQNLFPPGGLGYLQVEVPEFDAQGNTLGARMFQSFILFQDTGGAFHGPDKLDLFAGDGPKAEALAGHFTGDGRLYILVPKENGKK